MHAAWVRKQEDRLLFAYKSTRFDDELTATAPRALVCIDDLSIGGSFDRAGLGLVLDLFEFCFFFDECVFIRFELRFGRFDIGIVLNKHFGFGQFVEHF